MEDSLIIANTSLQTNQLDDINNNMLLHLTHQDNVFISTMKKEALKFLIFQCVMTIIHIFFVIPSNLFTIIVIAKNKGLWTTSNTILVINSSFMAIGSVLILFLRPAYFPHLLYNERNREIAYSISWWVCILTFRIGNNR